MTSPPQARAELGRLLRLPDPEIPLAEAALRIAEEEDPGVDVAHNLARLRAMGEELARDLTTYSGTEGSAPDGSLSRADRIRALRNYLYGEQGFHAVSDRAFFEPRNSLLHEVLDRRQGLPILLALVFMEVGQAIGLSLVGVGYPGHFLVRTADDGPELLLDPFNRGREISPLEAMDRLERFTGSKGLPATHTGGVTARHFLFRLVSNLKGAYLHGRDFERAAAAIDRLLMIHPEAHWERRDRGLLFMQLGWYHRARADFESYLAAVPGAADRDQVELRLAQARALGSLLN
jgi:regulator of sirC expression with transglutaminase-like and TPR domain